MSFRHGLDSTISVHCAFCGCKVTATHLEDDCQYNGLWATTLYAVVLQSAPHINIILDWGVSLPTCGGVFIPWGGAYLGFTVDSASLCPVQHVSWITLLFSGRMLPTSEKAMVRLGATCKQVLSWSLFGKLFCACPVLPPPPPQLRDAGDWVQLDNTSVAYQALYPTCNFLTAGSWMVQPRESSVVPPALHLHPRHYLASTAICVPQWRVAQRGVGEIVYWFHHGAHLPEWIRWPAFAQRQPRPAIS